MNTQNLKKQQGIATVLIVLLVGVALSASTLGVIYSVKSTQSKQVTSHASTNAQSAAWALAEAAKVYLSKLEASELTALDEAIGSAVAAGKQGYELVLALPANLAHLGESKVFINSKLTIDGKAAYELTIKAIDTLSKASASLNVVYQVVPGAAGKKCYPKGENYWSGDVIGEGIDLYMTGPLREFKVDGSYGTNGALHSIHGIQSFIVTGDLGLTGTSDEDNITYLQANGSIFLEIANTNIDETTKVHAGGDVVIVNQANLHFGEVIAGAGIKWGSHEGLTNNMQAGVKIAGPISYKDDNQSFINVELDEDGYRTTGVEDGETLGAINFVSPGASHKKLWTRASLDLPNNFTIGNAYSLDDLTLSGYNKAIGDAMAVNDLKCTSTPEITNPVAGASITGCTDIDLTDIGNSDAVKAEIEEQMVEFTPVDLPPSLIADADNYKANYAFRAIGTAPNHTIEVTVSNVKGLAEDTEKVFTLEDNILMEDGESTGFNICGDITETCITFTGSDLLTENELNGLDHVSDLKTEADLREATEDNAIAQAAVPDGLWTITGDARKLVPGVLYFDRDLQIVGYNDKEYANTILSAGSIKPVNDIRLAAINAVPEETLCNNHDLTIITQQRVAEPDISTSAAQEFFPPQNGTYPYPTNFCEEVEGKIVRVASEEDYIGQFGLMAGQENDDEEGNPVSYQGGNIYFGSSISILGRVIAGNAIKSYKGNAQVFGLVGSEARAEGKNKAVNELNESTLDINTEFMEVLDKSPDDDSGNCTPKDAIAPDNKLIWSRYL